MNGCACGVLSCEGCLDNGPVSRVVRIVVCDVCDQTTEHTYALEIACGTGWICGGCAQVAAVAEGYM